MDQHRVDRGTILILVLILAVNFLLNAQGIKWGLPDRWNIDQKVTETLRMANARTLVSTDFYHPPFYTYLLMLFLAPYFMYLKLTHYPLADAAAAAGDSWIRLASAFPDFATNLFLIARLLSCILGVLTVLVIFLTARRIYGGRVGLFAAGILATTMGFVGANHFELSCALINFLGALAVFYCIRELDRKTGRDVMLASFIAGLAVATKMNGIFVLPLPFVTCFLRKREEAPGMPLPALVRTSFLTRSGALLLLMCGLGFLAGWPTFFSALHGVKIGYTFYKGMLFSSRVDVPVLINFINYAIQVLTIFGIPFSVCIVYGLAVSVKRFFSGHASNDKCAVAGLFILSYFFMNGISVHHYYAYTKFIVLIVPPLAIFGAVGLYEALRVRPRIVRIVIGTAVFLYALAYTISGNAQFVSKDTRYRSTAWIEKNIPPGSTIEHVDQVDWLFSSRVLRNYRVIFLGRDSLTYKEKGFYKLNKTGDLSEVVAMVEDYCRMVNERMPSSEYFILFIPERADMDKREQPKSEYDKMVQGFLSGRFPYRLAAVFMPDNWKVLSPAVKGLSYPKNIIWNPIPDNAFLSPVILIYKRER